MHKKEEEAWFRENLKKVLAESKNYDLTDIKERTDEILANSSPCRISAESREDYSFYLLMTFDLPESLWREYSTVLEKVGGAFAVRGLPNDSFIEFTKKIKELRKKGITAPIQLNPNLFEKYQVELSPTILLLDGNHADRITGTVSIDYALEQFKKSGDTHNATDILDKLHGGVT